MNRNINSPFDRTNLINRFGLVSTTRGIKLNLSTDDRSIGDRHMVPKDAVLTGGNIPALIWAAKHMANKGIPWETWHANGPGGWFFNRPEKENGTFEYVVPKTVVCYESCWIAYMNSAYVSADKNVFNSLNTGFTTKRDSFIGRIKAVKWFKKGGNAKEFVTDITKGELGDIVFMGEDIGDHGHAVLLASYINGVETKKINGKTSRIIKFYVLGTSSGSQPGSYGGEEMIWTQNRAGKWICNHGGYEFKGYGHMKNVRFTEKQRKEALNLIEKIKRGE